MAVDLRRVVIGLALALACAHAEPAGAADQSLIDAAKKEGSVTWYTTFIVDQLVRPMAAAFESKYGIRIDYVRADGPDVALRIANEGKASHIQADVFDGLGVTALTKLGTVKSWLPDDISRLPKGYYDPAGHWVAANVFVYTPGFNTDLVSKDVAPKSLDDLLDSKWKGKMVWPAHNSFSSAPGFIGTMLAEMGEDKGLAYLQKLAQQNIADDSGSSRAVLDEVIAGEYPLALQITNSHAVISAAQGAPVAWIPMDPAMVVINPVSLTENSPHPNAGKLLLDFLLSNEGQQVLRDADYLPADPAVPAKDASLTPAGGHYRAQTFSPEMIDAQMPHWADIYRRLFQ